MSTPVPPPEPQQPQEPNQPTGGFPTYPAPGDGATQPGQAPTGAPQYPTAPAYPAAPGYQPYSAPQPTGSKTLAIIALVLSVLGCTSLIGIVLGIVALVKKRGTNDTASKVMAWIAIAVGALWLVIGTIIGISAYVVYDTCQDLGNGTHYVDGVTYTCDF